MAFLATDTSWFGRIVKTGYDIAGVDLVKQKGGYYKKADDSYVDPDEMGSLIRRQDSQCNTYGLDFQDGGNYFINANSNASFTFVSSFVGCQNDTASLMLVNQSNGDQYDCGSVPTVPDNAAELAACPVLKDQIASGDYLIIAVGNNGNGTPFAFQREFNITAGPQQTITSYVTPTITSTPIVITASTSVANTTITVPNTLSAITVPSPTFTQTITPPRSAVTQVSTSTQTFTRWSQVDTSTAIVVTPTCRTPLRPLHADPICTVFPRKMQIPAGVPGVQRRALIFGEAAAPASLPSPTKLCQKGIRPAPTSSSATRTRSLRMNNPDHTGPGLQKRAPDASVTTVTSPANTTVTLLGAASTETNIVASTTTFTFIDPAPQTVFAGQPVQTVMAAVQPVETVVQTAFARAYETQTFGLTWTQTLTTMPSAALAECRAVGGNFGRWW